MLPSLEVLISFFLFTLLLWNWVIRNINPCVVPVFSPSCVARLAGDCTLNSDSIIIVPKCSYIWVVTLFVQTSFGYQSTPRQNPDRISRSIHTAYLHSVETWLLLQLSVLLSVILHGFARI